MSDDVDESMSVYIGPSEGYDIHKMSDKKLRETIAMSRVSENSSVS